MYFIFQHCGQLVYPSAYLFILLSHRENFPMSLFLQSLILKNNYIIFHHMIRPLLITSFFVKKGGFRFLKIVFGNHSISLYSYSAVYQNYK